MFTVRYKSPNTLQTVFESIAQIWYNVFTM